MKYLMIAFSIFASAAFADNKIILHTGAFTAIASGCTDVGVNTWTEHYNEFEGMVVGTDCEIDFTSPTIKRPPVTGEYSVIVSMTAYDVATDCAIIAEDAHVPYRYSVEVWCNDNPFKRVRQ